MNKSIEIPVVSFHGAKIGLSEGQKIRKIEVAAVETLNRELLAAGSQIKELQDRLEEIYNNIEKNKADYAAGEVEKLTFIKDQDKFFSQQTKALDDLRAAVRNSTKIIAVMKTLLGEQSIE